MERRRREGERRRGLCGGRGGERGRWRRWGGEKQTWSPMGRGADRWPEWRVRAGPRGWRGAAGGHMVALGPRAVLREDLAAPREPAGWAAGRRRPIGARDSRRRPGPANRSEAAAASARKPTPS